MEALRVGPAVQRLPSSRLVVLDFSGTLSLEAVLFGVPEHLEQELRASGLERLGVTSVAFFWEALVNPTWEEGSTTHRGYTRVLADRLKQILSWQDDHPAAREATAAVERFLSSYLRHSTIDPAWRRSFAAILERDDTDVVVATDHYAEFTGHIVDELRAIDVPAVPALQAGPGDHVLVANSADLGCHKATPAFWERLKGARRRAATAIVAVVDDFGLNEQPLDAYAAPAKARKRLDDSVEILRHTYAARVAVFPFFLDRGDDVRGETLQRRYRALIARAEAFVRSELDKA